MKQELVKPYAIAKLREDFDCAKSHKEMIEVAFKARRMGFNALYTDFLDNTQRDADNCGLSFEVMEMIKSAVSEYEPEGAEA